MATVSVNPDRVNEGGTVVATVTLNREVDDEAAFTVALGATLATDDVDANIDGADGDVDATFADGVNTVTIAAGETTGTANIAITDDTEPEGDETFTVGLTAAPNGITFSQEVATVTILSNDSGGVSVGRIMGITGEGGEMATFTVVLNTQPTADVTITPTSSDTTEGTVTTPENGGALTFTPSNWNMRQTVTVTGVDDELTDDEQMYQIRFTVESADSNYDGLTIAPVTITNSDDDSPGITAVATDATTTEAGGEATISVRLNTQPTADVTVTLTSGDTTEGTASGALTFTPSNWNSLQTVTVTGVNDDDADGDQTYQITVGVASADRKYDGVIGSPVILTNSDDDYEVTIVATTQAQEPSTDGLFTIELNRSVPTGETVMAPYTVSGTATPGTDYAALTGSVTIAAGSDSGTVVVELIDDDQIDLAETVILTITEASSGTSRLLVGTPDTATVIITDDDAPSATLSVSDSTVTEEATADGPDGTEGIEAEFTLELTKLLVDGDDDVSVFFTVSGFAGSIGSAETDVTRLQAFATTTGSDVDTLGELATGTGRLDLDQPSGGIDNDIALDGSSTVAFRLSLPIDDGNVNDEIITLTINCVARGRTGTGLNGCTSAETADSANILVAGSAVVEEGAEITVDDDVPFERLPGQDFQASTLTDASNRSPRGLWSDGTTMWVLDNGVDVIYAYNLGTKLLDASQGTFDVSDEAQNTFGIWSDGTTMWVAVVESSASNIFAYNLETKAYDSSMDFDTLVDAGNNTPFGLWSDGTTMWVVDSAANARIYAYTLATKGYDSTMDFETLRDAENTDPSGLWSDGATMWVANDLASNAKIYAYTMSSKAYDGTMDFNTLDAAGNTNPSGLWSDGATMWVSDDADRMIYAYRMPPTS